MEQSMGAAAGITAAILWAFASCLYSRLPIRATTMTTFKNVLAAVLMGGLLVSVSIWHGVPLFQGSSRAWWYLGFSGVVGLLLGDIAYFRSLQLLGPRRALALTLLTPATAALLGRTQLGEVLSWSVWAGIIVTILGITIVMRARVAEQVESDGLDSTLHQSRATRSGIGFALMGILCQAVGSVAMKVGSQGIPSIEATFLRLFIASIAAIAIAAFSSQWQDFQRILTKPRELSKLSLATFLGTFLGVWMMLVSFKYCPVGVAATLTATSPLFVLPIVRIFYGERITPASWAGASVAIAGAGWLLLFASTAT